MKNLIIIGAGGHGRVVADIAKQTGLYDSIAFLDDHKPGKELFCPYFGKVSQAVDYIKTHAFFVAIGDTTVRRKITEELIEKGATIATIVHPSAIVSSAVKIGYGTVVMPGAIINTGATIGIGCIVNTSSSVDHDCVISDYCHISVGAHLCGTVNVGENTWIGAGATVINNIDICPNCLIGAGAVVVKSINVFGTYVGVPAALK